MSEHTLQPTRTGVFKYALLFAALFYFLVIGFDLMVGRSGSERAWLLECVVIIICAIFLSWLFARIRRGRFTKSEFWRLVIYCLFFSVAIEIFTVTLIVFNGESALSPLGIAYSFGEILGINFLCLLFGFGVLGRWVIAQELRKQPA